MRPGYYTGTAVLPLLLLYTTDYCCIVLPFDSSSRAFCCLWKEKFKILSRCCPLYYNNVLPPIREEKTDEGRRRWEPLAMAK